MKKIEIDSKLVTGVLAETVALDFRLSNNPVMSYIKADSALNTLYVLGILTHEELEQVQEMLHINFSCFMELKKCESEQEINKKEGGTN